METENYVLVNWREDAKPNQTRADILDNVLDELEHLHAKGLRPLHFIQRYGVWVCEKTSSYEKQEAA